MKKRIDTKRLISVAVAAATVVSVGCIAMADEIETNDEAAVVSETIEEAADSADAADTEETALPAEETALPAEETAVETEADVIAEISDENTADVVLTNEDVEIIYEVEEEAVTEDEAYVTNGWSHDNDGKWYYFKNGKAVTGWQQIDGLYYMFDSNGVMYIGRYYDSDFKATFIFGVRGNMLTGWVELGDDWYYCDPNSGKCAKGWAKINGDYYYFNESNNPYLRYAYGYTTKVTLSGNEYFFSASGKMLTGWVEYDDNWYYCDKSSGAAAKGWKKISNEWYYFYDSSYPYMCAETVTKLSDVHGNSDWYCFNKNGVMQKGGWYCVPGYKVVSEDNETYYEERDYWYYLGQDGKAVTGWKKISDKWYYFGGNSYSPSARVGLFQDEDGKFYFFDRETCAMVTNSWATPYYDSYYYYYYSSYNPDYIYLGSDGVAVRGWKKINDNWYYFGDPDSTNTPTMYKGVCYVEGYYYFFGDSGVMRSGGWYQYNGKYYFAQGSGVLLTSGMKMINGNIYCFDYSGRMITGYYWYNSKLYYFGNDGVCRNFNQ